MINTSIPAIIEIIADLLSLCLNRGRSPSIIGIDIGPTRGANHVIINPNTPPNDSAFIAIIIVSNANENVVIRASIRVLFLLYDFIPGKITGRISRVRTAEIVFESDDVMDIVLVKSEASTRPTKPAGKNFNAIKAYDWVGSARFFKKTGAANIGKKRMSGQSK